MNIFHVTASKCIVHMLSWNLSLFIVVKQSPACRVSGWRYSLISLERPIQGQPDCEVWSSSIALTSLSFIYVFLSVLGAELQHAHPHPPTRVALHLLPPLPTGSTINPHRQQHPAHHKRIKVSPACSGLHRLLGGTQWTWSGCRRANSVYHCKYNCLLLNNKIISTESSCTSYRCSCLSVVWFTNIRLHYSFIIHRCWIWYLNLL